MTDDEAAGAAAADAHRSRTAAGRNSTCSTGQSLANAIQFCPLNKRSKQAALHKTLKHILITKRLLPALNAG
jgi:hypothetical protein